MTLLVDPAVTPATGLSTWAKGGDIVRAGLEMTLGRRQFVTGLALGTFAATGVLASGEATAQIDDRPDTHNMLIVGDRTVFLSHLPMFVGVNQTGTAFRSPHRYQAIVEAIFTRQGKNVTSLYLEDRQAHAQTRIYTLNPEEFILPRLFTPRDSPQLTAFTATVFRGHLEQGGVPLPALQDVGVQVIRVIHARMFEPKIQKPDRLEYILVGKGAELFLVHSIFAPPDFDQVLSVRLHGHAPGDQELMKETRVTMPSRKNAAASRLREGEQVDAVLRIAQAESPSPVRIEAVRQLYFEEGELLVPHTFDTTPEEKKG